MFSKIQQASRQLAQMRKLKRQIESTETEGIAGGGIVRVRMTGARLISRVTIDPDAVRSGDAELLEELVKAAVNNASRKMERKLAAQMQGMGGSLGRLAARS